MGFYEIRFNGTVGGLAVATPFQAPSASPSTMHISLSRTSTGTFAASIENSAGTLTELAVRDRAAVGVAEPAHVRRLLRSISGLGHR